MSVLNFFFHCYGNPKQIAIKYLKITIEKNIQIEGVMSIFGEGISDILTD